MKSRIDLLNQYIIDEPDDPFNRYALALELIKTGDRQKALELFSYVHLNHSQYLPNYYHYGKLLMEERDVSPAQSILKAGLAIALKQNNKRTHSELLGLLDELDE
jgi:tetratricopeptide (TPR) repeat protein